MKKLLICIVLMAVQLTCVMAQPQDLDAKYATELLKPGTEAPDFKLKTLEGKSFKLSSLRGRYVVLDCWASWCPDCRKDIPNVLRMYEKFHQQGVEFVGLSFDTDREKWQQAVEQYGLCYTQVSELLRMKDSPLAQAYGVRWIPSMYLIAPDGKVVLGTVLSDKLEKTLYERCAKPFTSNVEQLTIDGSKGRLAAVIQKPELPAGGQCPMVVLSHGFTGNKEAQLLTLVADSLQAHGIASIRFDFNGHGKSEGDFQEMTVPNEVEDAKCVIEYVRDLRYVSKVAIAGHSQGGVVAAMTAGELTANDISAVVLFAPAGVIRDDAIRGLKPDLSFARELNPLDPPEYIEIWGGLKLGRDYIRSAQTLPIYATAQHYQGPALIIHGTADRTVPYTYGERFHDIWPSSELVILDAFDHGFSQCVYRVADLATDYLVKTLLPSASRQTAGE
ncbi:MAG: alpha/beta fold hydrolase [Prevotella sp.]|nr:alpha/beta fold hydrolase [Prevotella sp.]